MQAKTGSDILVETLEALGCTTVFGIPGIHNLDIYDALIGSSLRHVTARHESGAGFMADGWGRRTGTPGVALVITGPGLTNIATAMGEAFHDSVPMLVVSSQLPREIADQGTGYLHELRDSTLLARSVAKESRRVPDARLIADYLTAAYALATDGRPGPVHVEIPVDILQQEVATDAAGADAAAMPDPAGIDDLAEAIYATRAGATRAGGGGRDTGGAGTIAFVAGGGATGAAEQLRILAETLGAPVAQTLAGKGILPDDHPLCLGTRLHTPAVQALLADTDLVIGVGTQLSLTDLWETPLALGRRFARININPADLNRNYRADIAVAASAEAALEALLRRVEDAAAASRPTDAEAPRTAKQRVSDTIEAATAELPQVLGINAERFAHMKRIFEALRSALPQNAVLVTDMTSPAYVGLSEYPARAPRTFMHPVGYGTLGFALPAAVGISIAEPETPVCVLAGDGGFQFTMQELGVAAQESLSLPIVIYNDGGYGEIRRTEDDRHPGARIGVDLRTPDFVKLAATYGIEGCRVTDPAELEREVRAALGRGGPTIIEMEDR